MGRMLRIELRRAFYNKMFVLAVLIGSIFALLAFFGTRDYENVLSCLERPYNNSDYKVTVLEDAGTALMVWMPNKNVGNRYYYLLVTALPILAALPYGTAFINDLHSGVVYQFLTRTKRRNYFFAKLLVTFVSGGITAMLPLVVNLLVCMCYLPWGTPLYGYLRYPVKDNMVLMQLYYTHPVAYVLIYLLYTFVLYGLINCLCLACVYVEDNRIAIMLTPFILYFSTHVLLEYICGSSSYSLYGNANLIYMHKEKVFAVLLQLALLAAAAGAYLRRMKKDVVE